MAELIFLDFAVVEKLHKASLEVYGGSLGIRDQGLIESALGSAMNVYFYGAALSLRSAFLFVMA